MTKRATTNTEARSEAKRYTITVTPLTSDEWQQWVGDLRARYGRKHLVHVLATQPSNTHLDDAPQQWHVFDEDDPSTWPSESGFYWVVGYTGVEPDSFDFMTDGSYAEWENHTLDDV